MVRSLSTSRRAHSRRFAVSALATSIALALGSAHAQTVSATSVPITGRAPVVTIASITNQTVPGQAPAVGHVLHANASVVDPDNDGIVDTIYRWKRGGTEVGTGVDYTATAADEGQTLTLEVEATTDSASTDPDRGSATSTVNVVGNSAPTATPTITFDGVLDVDTVLTGNPGYADTENDPQGVHSYQWYRADDASRTNQVAISGATNSTYTVTSADRGKFIVLGVVPHATVGPAQGNEGFATTTVAVPVAATAPEAQTPSISGTLKTGNTLSAVFSYHDNEFDPPGTHKYQWFRDNGSGPVDIPLATNKDYVLTSADQGDHYIGVRITAVSTLAPTDGTPVEVRTAAKFIGNAPTATPTITFDGTLGVGTVLIGAANFIDADNDAEATHTYQWYRADNASRANMVAIDNANGTTYTVTNADETKFIVLGVIPRTTGGTPAQGSEAFAATTAAVAVDNTEPEARAPTISGDLKTGSTLSAAFDYFDNELDPQGEHKYQWYRDTGSTKTNIDGATSKDYVLTGAEQGDHYIGVRITPVSTVAPTDGTPVELRTTAKFTGVKPVVTNLKIEGRPTVGSIVEFKYDFTDDNNDQEGGTLYSWCRVDAGCGIGTAKSYTLTAADIGHNIYGLVGPKTLTGVPKGGNQVTAPQFPNIGTIQNEAAPTATPTIGGTAAVGQTLNGSPGYADLNNDPEGTHVYQWYRSDSATGAPRIAIDSANDADYVVTSADIGKYLVLGVIPHSIAGTPNEAGTEEFVVSSRVPGGMPIAKTPSVSGELKTGSKLTANYTFEDPDLDDEGATTFQWYRDTGASQTNIEGATSKDYILTGADQGDHYIGVRITPVSVNAPTDGTPVEVRTTSKFPGTAPSVTNVDITGTYASGETLTGSFDFVDPNNDQIDDDGMQYVWQISDPVSGSPTTIPNSNSKTLLLKPEYAGANRKVWFSVEKAKSLTGTPNEQSRPLSPPGMWQKARQGLIEGNAPTATPTIGGTVAQGELLTGSVGYVDAQNDPQGVHTYQWYRATDSDGNNRTPIDNTNYDTYTVQAADYDHYIVFEVTPRSSSGTPAAGNPTRKVTATKVGGSMPEARTASVGGTLQTGNTLSANFTYFDNELDTQGEHKYQWYRDNGTIKTNIENATGKDYVLTGADQGDHYVGVRITPVSVNAPTDGLPVEVRTTSKFVGTAPSVTNVDITGTYAAGETLTGSFDFVDANGDQIDEQGMEYSWQVSDPVSGSPVTVPNSNSRELKLKPEHAGANRKVWFSVDKAKSLTGAPNEQSRPLSPPGMWQKTRQGVIDGNAPTATPTISGTIAQGELLTGVVNYQDAQNDPQGVHTYQWYRATDSEGTNRTPITNATNISYTIQSADYDHYLVFEVIPRSSSGTPAAGDPAFAVTTAKLAATAPVANNPSVSGDLKTGSKLSANFDYEDGQSDAQGAHKYQWFRDNGTTQVNIDGATSKDYVLSGADQGDHYIGVRITPVSVNAPTDGTPVTARTTAKFTGTAPYIEADSVNITGTWKVGETLTGNYTFKDDENDPQDTAATQYAWYISDEAGLNPALISSATNKTYQLRAGDQGGVNKTIWFRVKNAKASSGTPNERMPSPAYQWQGFRTGEILGSKPTATPTITGTVAQGLTLTGVPNIVDADNDTMGVHTYQWYRATDSAGTNRTAISGATSISYAIQGADFNHYLVFEVVPKTTTGNPKNGDPASVVTDQLVGGSTPKALSASVGGTLKTGNTLSANWAYSDNENDPEGTHKYQWYRDTGTTKTNIENATGKDYVLTGADQGDHYIGVRITPVSTIAPTDGTPVEVRTSSKFLGTAPSVTNVDITGTYAAGETLTGSFDFVDANGDQIDEQGMEYSWQVSDPVSGSPVTVPNNNSRELQLKPEYAGANRKVWFSVDKAKSLTGTPNEQSRPLSPPGMWQKARQGLIEGNAPTATPTISGTVAQGELLTGSVNYADAQNDPQGVHTYQWYRATDSEGTNRTAITNATNISYTVQGADFDHYLVFEVIPRSSSGTPAAGDPTRKVTATKVGGAKPQVQSASVGGTLKTGNTLSANWTYFDNENDPAGTHTYQWYRDNGTAKTNIENATGKDYVLTGADQGDHYIGVRITPVSTIAPTDGTPVEVRTASKFAGTAPSVSGVDITGTYKVGETLTGTYSFVDNENDAIDTAGMEYVWQISDPVTGSPTTIPNSNSKTLLLKLEHTGANRKVWFSVEKAKALTGTPNLQTRPTSPDGMWQKARQGGIEGNAPTANPTISGMTDVGQTLTANPGYNDVDDDDQLGTTYQWCAYEADGTTLVACAAPSTSNTWVVPAGNLGKRLSVRVIPKSATGYPNSGDEVESAKTVAISLSFANDTDYIIPLYGSVDSAVTVSGVAGSASASAYVGVDVDTVAKAKVKLQLIAPDGSIYLLKDFGPPHGQGLHQVFTVDLSSETANGQWKLRAFNDHYHDFVLERWWIRPRP